MKNLILVHGAWHGAWCWKDVIQNLPLSYKVIAPDLPAHGQDVQDPKSIYFKDYINHLIQVIGQVKAPVTLVGHSYAGFIISEVASRMPAHIQELIYVNAFIPNIGESLLSLCANLSSQHLTPFLNMNEEHNTLSIEPIGIIEEFMYNLSKPEDIPLAAIKAEPLRPLFESVHLTEAFQTIPKRAIISSQDKTLNMQDQIFMCKRQQVPYTTIQTDHCPFTSNPKELLSMLLKQPEAIYETVI